MIISRDKNMNIEMLYLLKLQVSYFIEFCYLLDLRIEK